MTCHCQPLSCVPLEKSSSFEGEAGEWGGAGLVGSQSGREGCGRKLIRPCAAVASNQGPRGGFSLQLGGEAAVAQSSRAPWAAPSQAPPHKQPNSNKVGRSPERGAQHTFTLLENSTALSGPQWAGNNNIPASTLIVCATGPLLRAQGPLCKNRGRPPAQSPEYGASLQD